MSKTTLLTDSPSDPRDNGDICVWILFDDGREEKVLQHPYDWPESTSVYAIPSEEKSDIIYFVSDESPDGIRCCLRDVDWARVTYVRAHAGRGSVRMWKNAWYRDAERVRKRAHKRLV